MIKLNCKICGKNFGVSPNRVKKALYCSMECYGKSKIGVEWKEETKKKLSKTLTGHIAYYHPIKELSHFWKGGRVSLFCKTCGSKFNVKLYRENTAKYCCSKCKNDDNLGLSSPNEKIRKSYEYKLWRTAVFKRDNYTCQECGKHGGYLIAHHLKPFSIFPEFRLDIKNGLVLCKDCHKNKHKGIKKLFIISTMVAKLDNF